MAEAFIVRRGGGNAKKLPTLNASYPANVTVSGASTTSATFKVEIALDGKPAQYAYQWYVNGTAVSGATSSSYTRTGLITKGTWTVYCKVTNEAGTVQSRTATLTVNHTVLYFNGNECTANSGGWTSDKYSDYNMASYTKNDNSITLTLSKLSTGITVRTSNKISLSGYTKIKFNISGYTFGRESYIGVSSVVNFPQYPEARTEVPAKTTGTYSVDISSLSSSLYVGIYRWLAYNDSTSYGGSITFNKVWLE